MRAILQYDRDEEQENSTSEDFSKIPPSCWLFLTVLWFSYLMCLQTLIRKFKRHADVISSSLDVWIMQADLLLHCHNLQTVCTDTTSLYLPSNLRDGAWFLPVTLPSLTCGGGYLERTARWPVPGQDWRLKPEPSFQPRVYPTGFCCQSALKI